MYKDKQDEEKKEEKEKKREKQKAADLAAGTARDAKGDPISCLSTSTYSKDECKPVLQNYCSKTDNAGKAGCMAFQKLICDAADAPQSYCLSVAVAPYCKQEGALIATSPACVWLKERPSSCATTYESSVSCLSRMSPAQLTEACVNFPNDPLCLAQASGKVVTQPLSGSESAIAIHSGGNTNSNTSGNSFNSLVGGGSSDQASTASLWDSNSAGIRGLCARGELNCGSSGK